MTDFQDGASLCCPGSSEGQIGPEGYPVDQAGLQTADCQGNPSNHDE